MLDLLNMGDVAKELRVSIHTVRAWAFQRRFPVIKLGRRVFVERAAMEKFVREGLVEARKK